MTKDEQLEMFQVQASWLQAEYERTISARRMNWRKFNEIQLRTSQMNREFSNFWRSYIA